MRSCRARNFVSTEAAGVTKTLPKYPADRPCSGSPDLSRPGLVAGALGRRAAAAALLHRASPSRILRQPSRVFFSSFSSHPTNTSDLTSDTTRYLVVSFLRRITWLYSYLLQHIASIYRHLLFNRRPFSVIALPHATLLAHKRRPATATPYIYLYTYRLSLWPGRNVQQTKAVCSQVTASAQGQTPRRPRRAEAQQQQQAPRECEWCARCQQR